MGKITGYAIMAIGILVVALPILAKGLLEKLPFQPFWIIIGGLIIMGFGFVMLKPTSGSSKARQIEEEVPIYHGNKIVGYRKDKR